MSLSSRIEPKKLILSNVSKCNSLNACKSAPTSVDRTIAKSSSSVETIKKMFCPIPNIRQTCWFNAVAQAFQCTQAIGHILEQLSDVVDLHGCEVICNDMVSALQQSLLVNAFSYLRTKAPQPLPLRTLK